MSLPAEQGMAAFQRRAWGEAYRHLRVAAEADDAPLEVLEQLAVAAYLTGRDDESAGAWGRAYQGHVDAGDRTRAARCCFWLGWGLFYKGQMAQCGGWFGRAQGLVDEHGADCIERGLLLVPQGCAQLFGQNDAAAAYDTFDEAGRTGARFGSVDLVAIGQLGCGQSLVRLGRQQEGMALLDQAMVSVATGDLSPLFAGTVYCAVILECRRTFDLRRAVEWTGALKAWCDSDPDLVPYRGQCLVHRSEIMQARGEWAEAMAEAVRAAEVLALPPPQPALGTAQYQQGELHRLRGDFGAAEEAYREANRWGRIPQPGLTLLRLAQGRVDAARAAIGRALEEAGDVAQRAALLPASVESALAAGTAPEARAEAEELLAIAERLAAPLLQAAAAHALGAVCLAEGDGRQACQELRRAVAGWQELDGPYDVARARLLLGQACLALGDTDTAALEFDAARWAFNRLGAAPDLARADALSGTAARPTGGLSARELEVLGQVVQGRTNREIAVALHVSEHTVRRHLQNIFAKIGVSSRAAATAFALQHQLV